METVTGPEVEARHAGKAALTLPHRVHTFGTHVRRGVSDMVYTKRIVDHCGRLMYLRPALASRSITS